MAKRPGSMARDATLQSMRRRASVLFGIFALTSFTLRAQNPVEAARQWRIQHQSEILQGFSALLSIPNVAADPANLRRNADTLISLLRQRHFATRLLAVPGAPPVVFGERQTPSAKHTIVFYAHYDGQPVTPSEWQGSAPFVPALREVDGEERIFARSAGDDKAAIYAQLVALDALQAAHIPLRANIRFVWEGEEEAGSPHLEQILNANRDLVHGDVWLVCDGPVDQSRQQTLVFGARGDAHLEITVYGANRGLHSGHYGNWAPNPAMMLVQLLASMKDGQGRVLIPHFYEGIMPLGAVENNALARAPVNDDRLRQELSLGHVDGGGAHLLDLLNLPSLNINGISSGQTGAHATNVIPVTATADLDLRVVVGIDWRQQQDRVVDYIRSQGYFVVQTTPNREVLLQHAKVALIKKDSAGYNAARTPMDLPIAEEVLSAVKAARGTVIEWPTMGGSVPLGAMERAAGTRTITVPIANHDDNQHSANENLRLQNLWDGIETMASLLHMD
jgi:acetylornithine deacetylase/succinyl-diaminopimelate desuccinylase-like protein